MKCFFLFCLGPDTPEDSLAECPGCSSCVSLLAQPPVQQLGTTCVLPELWDTVLKGTHVTVGSYVQKRAERTAVSIRHSDNGSPIKRCDSSKAREHLCLGEQPPSLSTLCQKSSHREQSLLFHAQIRLEPQMAPRNNDTGAISQRCEGLVPFPNADFQWEGRVSKKPREAVERDCWSLVCSLLLPESLLGFQTPIPKSQYCFVFVPPDVLSVKGTRCRGWFSRIMKTEPVPPFPPVFSSRECHSPKLNPDIMLRVICNTLSLQSSFLVPIRDQKLNRCLQERTYWPLAQMQGWGAGRSEILVRLSSFNPAGIQSLQGQERQVGGFHRQVNWKVFLLCTH